VSLLACPLWVKSRHSAMSKQCPLCPQKRTLVERVVMSALCQKRSRRNQITESDNTAYLNGGFSFGFQLTKNTPRTQTAMPRSAIGASRSSNNAQAISAVTGGVR
jgi:hypothetical protein